MGADVLVDEVLEELVVAVLVEGHALAEHFKEVLLLFLEFEVVFLDNFLDGLIHY